MESSSPERNPTGAQAPLRAVQSSTDPQNFTLILCIVDFKLFSHDILVATAVARSSCGCETLHSECSSTTGGHRPYLRSPRAFVATEEASKLLKWFFAMIFAWTQGVAAQSRATRRACKHATSWCSLFLDLPQRKLVLASFFSNCHN